MKKLNKSNLMIESNANCFNCKIIDNICNNYIKLLNELNDENLDIFQKQINDLEKYLCNGYELIKVLESNGFYKNINNNLEIDMSKISDINNYLSGKYSDEEFDEMKKFNNDFKKNLNLSESRWCKICGCRKRDIFKI